MIHEARARMAPIAMQAFFFLFLSPPYYPPLCSGKLKHDEKKRGKVMKITPGSDEDSGEAAVEKTVAGENVKQQRQSLAVVLAEAIAAARASNAAGKAAAKAGETSKAAGMFRHGADILWEALTAAHTERRSGGGLEGESEVEDTLTETRRLFIDCLNNASAMLHKSGFFREAEAAATRVLQSPAVLGDAGAKNSKARFRRCRARLSR